MRTRRLFLLCLALLSVAAGAQPRDDRIGGFIVKLDKSVGAPDYVSAGLAGSFSAAAGHPLSVGRHLSGQTTLVELDSPVEHATAERIAAELSARADVLYAAPNYRRWPTLVPSDTRFNDQWYLHAAVSVPGAANLPAAWDITTGADGTIVAVLDTGILGTHADFSRILPGYDFVVNNPTFNIQENDLDPGRDADASDPGDGTAANECAAGFPATNSSWHGTLVNGIIGATSDNALGISGIDHRARMLPVRVLGKCGGTDADIVDGARWAMGLNVPGVPDNPNPASILNLSLGGFGPCTAAYQDAFQDADQQGVVVVVSAGNDGLDLGVPGNDVAPAECVGAFTVAATTRGGAETIYTNVGARIDIAAPGGAANTVAAGILTTTDSSTGSPPANDSIYEPVIGTSFSAPVVSGVMSLALGLNPNLTPTQLEQLLILHARAFPTGTVDGFRDCITANCGAGLVDAHRVIAAVSGGSIPGVFADGAKIEIFGDNSSRSGGLAAGALVLGLLIAAGVAPRVRRRR